MQKAWHMQGYFQLSIGGPIPFPGCASRRASTPGRTFGIRNEGLFHGCEGDAVLVRHNIIINNHL